MFLNIFTNIIIISTKIRSQKQLRQTALRIRDVYSQEQTICNSQIELKSGNAHLCRRTWNDEANYKFVLASARSLW